MFGRHNLSLIGLQHIHVIYLININHPISSCKFPEKKTKFEVIEGHDQTDKTESNVRRV